MHMWPAVYALTADSRLIPTFAFCGSLQRTPQAFDVEAVVLHSGLDAGTVAAFLHENMLHFVADTAIEDAADALAYLSDAGAHAHMHLMLLHPLLSQFANAGL